MFDSWFDARFRSAAVQTYRLWPLRLLIAGVLCVLLGHAAGWRAAAVWTIAALAVETPLTLKTRPAARGRELSRAQSWQIFWTYALAVTTWSAAGAILWNAASPASDVAAAGFFAGHLPYVE